MSEKMRAEILSRKYKGEEATLGDFLSLITDRTGLQDRDLEAVKGFVIQTLAGVRDLAAIYPDDRLLNDKESYGEELLANYNLQSTVIYLTTKQRDLIKPDSPIYLELREIGLESDSEGERARANIREIKRLQDIYCVSYSPITLGNIKGVSIEALDESSALDIVVEYDVPHGEASNRTENYKGAFELLNKELVTIFTENGYATNGAQFILSRTPDWDYRSVKERIASIEEGSGSLKQKRDAA